MGYALNGVIAAYPGAADAIRAKLTQPGKDMLESVSHQCVGQTAIDFAFRHLQPYFTDDISQLVDEEPFRPCSICSASGDSSRTRPC